MTSSAAPDSPSSMPWWHTLQLGELQRAKAVITSFESGESAHSEDSKATFARALALRILFFSDDEARFIVNRALSTGCLEFLPALVAGKDPNGLTAWLMRCKGIEDGLRMCSNLFEGSGRERLAKHARRLERITQTYKVTYIEFIVAGEVDVVRLNRELAERELEFK